MLQSLKGKPMNETKLVGWEGVLINALRIKFLVYLEV